MASAVALSRDEQGTFKLMTTQRFQQPLDEVFGFFADAFNLQRITPPWLHFKILTPAPIEMQVGALIDYRIKLHGVPMRWRTEITAWEPPYRFVDEQRRGPYSLWHHEHRFYSQGGETLVEDEVSYRMFGGSFTHLFVRKDLERIFSYRQDALASVFSTS